MVYRPPILPPSPGLTTASAVGNPLGFHGLEHDPETGLSKSWISPIASPRHDAISSFVTVPIYSSPGKPLNALRPHASIS